MRSKNRSTNFPTILKLNYGNYHATSFFLSLLTLNMEEMNINSSNGFKINAVETMSLS